MMIVDLSIEDDAHAAVLVGHGLGAQRGQVNNTKPAMDQPGRAGGPDAPFVRPAMLERSLHRAQDRLGERLLEINDARYAAHGVWKLTSGSSRALMLRARRPGGRWH